jgi:hypothetical protein
MRKILPPPRRFAPPHPANRAEAAGVRRLTLTPAPLPVAGRGEIRDARFVRKKRIKKDGNSASPSGRRGNRRDTIHAVPENRW